ncbi:hypothetical protein XM57_04950 [Burkholderia cepacia]|nr:hypothetical protein XM57_04950 [Burkholderia cepacia]ETP66744.1 hypothetical protein BDSB_01470 [Burkholderia dolosa PC543]
MPILYFIEPRRIDAIQILLDRCGDVQRHIEDANAVIVPCLNDCRFQLIEERFKPPRPVDIQEPRLR